MMDYMHILELFEIISNISEVSSVECLKQSRISITGSSLINRKNQIHKQKQTKS